MKILAVVLFAITLPLLFTAIAHSVEDDTRDWFPFTPTNDSGPSVIGMEDWLDKPAGRQGRIKRDGGRLVYSNRPIKLWGLNLCYSNCAPEKTLADKRAAFYAKYGINSVRLHKFADGPGWAGIQSADSCVEYDPAALDRMDYQIAQFKKAGIYVKLSAHFGAQKLGPVDRRYVPYLEEFGTFAGEKNRIETPHSAIHYSPELQQVQILQMTNLLKHKNPYTGLTYAEDPAVGFVEIINEQSILFYTSMNPLKASPTLRRQTAERFSDWLKARYGTHEKLRAAWGDKAFDTFAGDGFAPVGEHLQKRNILPLGNPWYWDPAQLNGSQAFQKQRLLDTLQFLYQMQSGFYDRYVRAMREAGYPGEIVGSNWQAGRAYSHFLNLHSDYRVGTIDRHNYFGGGGKPGEPFNNATLLRSAGAELLSSGLQQVANRPFMLSEWIHVYPNEWGVEGPALLGAYGLGLQGWDVSYMFQNGDSGGFSERIGRDQWDATAPQVLGVFPAVARQVLRGDVKESEIRAPLYVHTPSLTEAKLGVTDRTAQAYDLKGFDTDKVPARALAAARVAVEFTDTYRDTPAFDLAPFEKDGFLVSSTGQLRWKEGRESKHGGYFTVDTPGTKAVVGFAQGQQCRLGEVTITPQSHFGAIYVTARDRDTAIGNARSLIVTAIARARNTGMQLNAEENRILEPGRAPIVMEPVKAAIRIGGPARIAAVYVLDHDGRRTQKTLPVEKGGFTMDGARDKTPYYEVVLAQSESDGGGAAASAAASTPRAGGIIAPGASLEKLSGEFAFTEGPASDARGNVFFTDQPNDRIMRWGVDNKLTTFRKPSGRANGLCFDARGNLWVCADEKNELWRIDTKGRVTVVVKDYQGKLLNGPNDVWVRSDGGVYFTDPFYKRPYWQRGPMEQEVQAVYYLSPDHKKLTRVVEDMQQPNGVIGTPDGKTLYVADIGGGKTYAYDIRPDGALANKRLFCSLGSDGMTIDSDGNVYLTGKGVTVFDRTGKQIEQIDVPEGWTANVCFGGRDARTLFITASKGLYGLRMRVKGVGSQ